MGESSDLEVQTEPWVLWFLNRLDDKKIWAPFQVEIVMRSGARYYVHSRVGRLGERGSGMRVWDLRAFDTSEIETLKANLDGLDADNIPADEKKIHAKLDWAILHFDAADIEHAVEWHNRYWTKS